MGCKRAKIVSPSSALRVFETMPCNFPKYFITKFSNLAAKKPEVTPVKVKPIKEPKREEKKSKEKAAPPPIPKPVQSVQSVTVSTEKENTPYFVTNSDGYQEVQYFSEVIMGLCV